MSSAVPARSSSYATPTSYASANSSYRESVFAWLRESNRWLILILTIVLGMALMNIRILQGLYDVIKHIILLVYRIGVRILIAIGLVTGNLFELTGNIVGESGDIAEYALDNVGKTLKNSAGEPSTFPRTPQPYLAQPQPEEKVDKPYVWNQSLPANMSTNEPSQMGVKWCLVGDATAKKGCMKMNTNDKCVSGRSFNAIQDCVLATYQ